MTNNANQLRLIAAEIIRKLWAAGETTQLELLEMQAKRSLEEPYSEARHGPKDYDPQAFGPKGGE